MFISELIFSSFMQFTINVSLLFYVTLFVCIVLSCVKCCRTVFSKFVLSFLSVFLFINFGTLLLFGFGLDVISA